MSLKHYFQKIILKRGEPPREKKFHSFDTARSVGIVFPVMDEQSEEAFNVLRNALKKYSIPFDGLAIESSKSPVNMFWCISNPNITVINRKEVNWMGMISNEENISGFTGFNYDLAINMSVDDSFTCRYVIRRMRASFKIGLGTRNDPTYDMVIQPHGEDATFTQLELAEEIVLYLSTIKSK
ncbi:MAG: hypothetical protein LKK19_00380 [Bacteroidales bacterium]|jgi:hypothetical protein|nr:hypothetical protein [Bacteroidales bacterium]MCI2121148.1 hypothetical protein [Bacteroidales bacterium]MCI2144737.1 hypothetical protein [Bacteroidales bacterium]